MINVMNSHSGNVLVERIVDAAIKLYNKDDATYQEVRLFVMTNLERISLNESFARAGKIHTYMSVMDEFKERALESYITSLHA